jgi:LmbE family N-acetylglucosaminyl deacetylase
VPLAAMQRRTLILSPHLDDAVLSLWHVLDGPGDVEVVNVFTGRPANGRLGWWDRLTGATDAGVRLRERTAEDRAALAATGRQARQLGLLDHQHRDAAVERAALDHALGEAASEGRLLAPAALAGHPDHRAVRDAALALRREGREVALYADLPHAVGFGWPASVTGADAQAYLDPSAQWERELASGGLSLAGLRLDVRRLDDAAHERKLAAVRCYGTQLPALEAASNGRLLGGDLRYEVVFELA